VAPKNYYEILEIEPAASQEEIKRAFRLQIARYHPDKVQHLGKEFQAMAAERAAELTEAYRILSDANLREQYNQMRGQPSPASAPAAAPHAPERPAAVETPDPAPKHDSHSPPPKAEPGRTGAQFSHERATRDEFVRKATLSRVQAALEAVSGGSYDQATVRGFDLACTPKSKLFGRNKNPRLLMRFVSQVDAPAIADTWTQALKWAGKEEVCVCLIGSGMASARELATSIHEQMRKAPTARVTLIPVDSRDWQAHMPVDAPAIAKTLLTRLRTGA
jgi:curved DNA-binding protein CbpA